MEELSDTELIKQFIKGDESALNELISKYFKQIFYFAKTYVKQDFVAEDITQEVFVKLWKHAKKFDQNKNFKTWLFQITKNTCIDFLRKNKQILAEDMNEEIFDSVLENTIDTKPLPDTLLDSKIFEQNFQTILTNLPQKQAQAIELHLRQELTFIEISEILNESINTVKSRYKRGLEEVKQQLLKMHQNQTKSV